MSQSRMHRGYQTQKLAAVYLRRWWPYAEPVGAGRAGADITGVPFDIELKARSRVDLPLLMRQLATRKDGRIGFGVLRLNGQGPASIGDWVAVMRFADLVELLAEHYNVSPDELPEELQP